jgi:hypothetical protein
MYMYTYTQSSIMHAAFEVNEHYYYLFKLDFSVRGEEGLYRDKWNKRSSLCI